MRTHYRTAGAALLVGASLTAAHRADACSLAMWADNGQCVVIGRNVDWVEVPPTDLWALPRGMPREGVVSGQPLTWVSKYGSVVGVAYGAVVNAGMNEKGLVANCQWLATGDHGERVPTEPAISESQWPQFYLDMFATVEEAVAWTQEHPFQVRGTMLGDEVSMQQLAIQDATGDSAIICYIDGQLQIFHDKRYRIVTNEPAYNIQLQNLGNYDGFGGDLPLPGASDAAARFVRGAYYLINLPEPTSPRETYAGVASVMHSMAQPMRKPEPGKPNQSSTVYMILFDATNLGVYFESTSTIFPIWVKLKELDFSEGQPLRRLRNVNTEDRSGDVTAQMEATPQGFFFAPGL